MHKCIYCGSNTHSNEQCRSPAKFQTMQSLYGSINQFTTYDPLMRSMAVCKMPPFVRGARLLPIVLDGWERGLDPAQTAMEAMHMGYSLCVVLPLIKLEWARMDARFAEHEAKHADQYLYEDVPTVPLNEL